MTIYTSELNNPKLGYVEEIDASYANASEENRIEFISKTASISRGKESFQNPKGRYEMLLKEGALNTASRCLEFIPIVLYGELDLIVMGNSHKYGHLKNCVRIYLDKENKSVFTCDLNEFMNDLVRYGYFEWRTPKKGTSLDYGKFKLYTNLRAVLKAGIPYEKTLGLYGYGKEYEDFKVLKMSIPMFVFNHLITHTRLSKETRSDRVTALDPGNYWLPSDLATKAKNYTGDLRKVEDPALRIEISNFLNALKTQILVDPDHNKIVQLMLNTGQDVVSQGLRVLGYPKEIYQRAMLEFRYKETIVAGWSNDEITWKNFLRERGGSSDWKNWVQPETKELAIKIQELLQI